MPATPDPKPMQAYVTAEDERRAWTQGIQDAGRAAVSKDQGERTQADRDAINRAASVEGIYPEPYGEGEAPAEQPYEVRNRQQKAITKGLEEGQPVGEHVVFGKPQTQVREVRQTVDGPVEEEPSDVTRKLVENQEKGGGAQTPADRPDAKKDKEEAQQQRLQQAKRAQQPQPKQE